MKTTKLNFAKLTFDKPLFYKTLFAIALPIAIQNLISFSINLADTVMLSWASEADELVAAANFANQPFFLLVITMFGLGGGGISIASQYWGKGDLEAIRRITAIIIHIGVIMSFIMGLAVLIFPEAVMGLFTKEAQVIAKGADYLKIVGWSYFLCGISFAIMNMLRSVEVVKISLFADLISLFVSVFLNWALIFGNLGFPALGIKGAALGTLIARIIGFVIYVVYLFIIDKRLNFRLKNLFVFDKALFADVRKYGFPSMFNETGWASGMVAQTAIIGHITYSLGEPAAANAIVANIFQLFLVLLLGASNAALVLIGKSIGEGRIDEARLKAKELFKLGVIMGLISAAFVFLTKDFAVSLFGLTEETALLANQIMACSAAVVFFASVATMSIVGIFRGGGDTRFCLALEMITLWGVAIPLMLILAFVLKLPVPLVYLGMKSDELMKTIVSAIRIRGTKWIRVLTR